jgi:hypothetical protein
MLTAEDLKDDHFRYDDELPQGWALVRPVVIWFGGKSYCVDYDGHPGHVVALVHAYLGRQDKLMGDN